MDVLSYEGLLSSDRYYSKDEIDKVFNSSYKINFNHSLVLKSAELFEKYENENLLDSCVNGKNFKVSKILLHDLLKDDGMYKYLIKNMDDNLSDAVKIVYVIDANTCYSFKLNCAEMAEALNKIATELSVKGKMRLALINSLTSPHLLTQKYCMTTYSSSIDGKEIIIPATYLIDLLLAPEEEFKSKIESSHMGYSKEMIEYAIVDFIERENILQKYRFAEEVIEKYKRIKDSIIVDFEFLFKKPVTNNINDVDENINSVSIPNYLESLKKRLMIENYSPLEIVLYIYFKMRNYYSFDDNFHLPKKSEDLTSITIKEFIYLFAKILDELRIEFNIDQSIIPGVTKETTKLSFRFSEFLVSLDYLDNLSKNDPTGIKIGDDVIGLKSNNTDAISKTKFNELIEKMYKVFSNDKKQELDFKSKLQEYKENYQIYRLSKKEKVNILLMAIARKDLKGIDNINYMQRIFNNVFTKDENITISFIGINPLKDEFNVTPLTIVTVLDNDKYYYYKIDSKNRDTIVHTTKNELDEMFAMGYRYYWGPNNFIPGLESR